MTVKVKVINIIDDKTLKCSALVYKKHPRYEKYVTSVKKYLVHHDGSKVKIGDDVTISETRPLSKRKRWILN